MNKLGNLLINVMTIMCFALMSSSFAHAANNDTFFGKKAKGKWIIGAKVATIDTNVESVEDADAVGIVAGYEFFRTVGDYGGSSTIEFEYVRSDETSIIKGLTSYEADIANLFFTYRTAGKIYFKAKAGLSYTDLTIRTPAFEADLEDVSLAGGVGFGYRVGDYGVVEVEYSASTGDSDLGLVGVNALLEF